MTIVIGTADDMITMACATDARALATRAAVPGVGRPALAWASGADLPIPRIAMEAASGEDREYLR